MLPRFVQDLSYHPAAHQIVRVLGLQKLAQNLYYRFAQRGQFTEISAGGQKARFVSRSYRDLRSLESSAREAALMRLLAETQPCDVVYDIGANRGLYTILLARKAKQVIAFEPESESFGQLLENIQINGLANVTAFRKAIGDHNATETLYLGNGIGAIDSGQLTLEWKQGATEVINLVHGDAFLQVQGLPAATIVKIDVEGYEGAVLEGFRHTLARPTCRLICCEIHPSVLPSPMTTQGIVDQLKDLGFPVIRLYPHKSEFHAFAYKEAREI